MSAPESGKVQLEIDADVLARLFESGQLCAGEFRCLDQESKQRVWRLCLKTCGKCLGQAQTLEQAGKHIEVIQAAYYHQKQ